MRIVRRCVWLVVGGLCVSCGGATEPPPSNGPFAIARFEGVPSDTALDVLDDLVFPLRAVDTKGNVINDLSGLVTVVSDQPTVASIATPVGTSTTIAGNAFGTAVLTLTAANSNVLGSAPVTFTVTVKVRPHALLLEFPAGAAHVEVYGVSDDRNVGGAAYDREGVNGAMAWRYTPGAGSQLLTNLAPAGQLSQVRGVAGDGRMVGYSSARKTLWSAAGVPTDLGAPGIATGINRSGAIIYYAPVSSPAGQRNEPFYRAPNGDVISLGTMGGSEAIGWDLAEDGGVTGTVVNNGPRPFYWSQQLGMIAIPTVAGFASGEGVTTGGRVVGIMSYGPGFLYQKGFYWSAAEGLTELSGFDTDEFVRAEDINAAGIVVGSSQNLSTPTKPSRSRAFLWTKAGGFVDLTGKLPRPTRAFAISDFGVIAGTMESPPTTPPGNNQQPVIWLLRRP